MPRCKFVVFYVKEMATRLYRLGHTLNNLAILSDERL